MSQVADQVIALMTEKTNNVMALRLDSRVDTLGIESLELVEIIFEMEDRFGIRVELNADELSKQFRTIRDVVAAIEDQVADAS